MDADKVAKLIRELLAEVGGDAGWEDLKETPERVAAMLGELTSGYRMDPKAILDKQFGENSGMVVLKDIKFYSLCAHHLLPFYGHVHIGYIPNGRIAGLSKLVRLVDCFSKRLQVQERMTRQIADAIAEALEPRGVIVVAEARHLCMEMRGVRNGALVVTSEVRGDFEKPELRDRFLALVGKGREAEGLNSHGPEGRPPEGVVQKTEFNRDEALNASVTLYRGGSSGQPPSGLELAVARILEFTGLDYQYRKEVQVDEGLSVKPTFTTSRGFIEVVEDSDGRLKEVKELVSMLKKARPEAPVLVIAKAPFPRDFEPIGAPIVALGTGGSLSLTRQSIFLEDPSLALDYSHILPKGQKCSVLHGHTASVLLEIIGEPQEGMIVDFGEAKEIAKDVLGALDHKLIISRRYVAGEDPTHYRIEFEGPQGSFDLKVPKASVHLLEGEATSENLAQEIARLLIDRLPENVKGVGVCLYEGLAKGSRIMAQRG